MPVPVILFWAVLFWAVFPGAAFLPASAAAAPARSAIFAGGHFWVMQQVFAGVPGVSNVVAGYTGGVGDHPGFAEVAAGGTGHRMAVLVTYDPAVTSYEALLQVFWRHIDPGDGEGQFCDRGHAWSPAIYYTDAAQRRIADDAKMLLEADSTRFGGSGLHVDITVAGPFYAAESHHQNYYLKNPLRYKFYRTRCGRDQRLYTLWGASPSP